MTNDKWATMHSSVFSDAGRLLRWAVATLRPHGAMRYRCPVAGSFVLVTDPPTLRKLARPRARIRCGSCGEMHMVAHEPAGDGAAVIVEPRGQA